MRLPGRFLTPPSLVSPGTAPAAKPSLTSTVLEAPKQAHSHQDTVSSPGHGAMRNVSERGQQQKNSIDPKRSDILDTPDRGQQQEDIIYVMWTSGSTGSAKAVCGTATGMLSLTLTWMALPMTCLPKHDVTAQPLERLKLTSCLMSQQLNRHDSGCSSSSG